MIDDNKTDVDVLMAIVSELKKLNPEVQKRTLQAVATFLGIDIMPTVFAPTLQTHAVHNVPFSENRDMSPKDFLKDKLPQTDVERVACLAYYLTHYRNIPHFKTIDISTLNTDAAQPKFSNPAMAVANAVRAGFIVSASKGSNQLSAAGEVFVQALPDREAARANVSNMRIKKRNKKSSTKNLDRELN